ncbi:MAG: glycosyltransferase family 39 protein [Alphaproteobacteria bacterium]|nr:glycosyltransferase family 39 protein [Alphaproteobacteria bacterium]
MLMLGSKLAQSPRKLFIIFLVLHFAALAVVALAVQPNLPLDVIEQLGWSRDLQWVYFKHPPLPAAILAALMSLSGFNLALAALAAPFASILALILIFCFARRLVGEGRALIAATLCEGVIYYNYTALQFNHDTVQLPLWVGLAWCGHRVLRDNRGWFWLGLLAGVCLLGKYASVMLFLAIFLAFSLTPEGRARFRNGRGIGLAVAGFLVLMIPHIYGLWQINFTPFQFPLQRAEIASDWFNHLVYPLQFLASQSLAVAGLILLSLYFWVKTPSRNPQNNSLGHCQIFADSLAISQSDKIYITLIALGPFGLSLLTEGIFGIKFRDMWGVPMFSLLGLMVMVLTAHNQIAKHRMTYYAASVMGLMLFAATTHAATIIYSPYYRNQGDHMHYPREAMMAIMRPVWDKETQGKKLSIVVADFWNGGLFAAYDADHPSVMLEGQAAKAPWITKQRLAEQGALVIWQNGHNGDNPYPDLEAWFGRDNLAAHWVPQTPLALPYTTKAKVANVRLGWAILLPMK